MLIEVEAKRLQAVKDREAVHRKMEEQVTLTQSHTAEKSGATIKLVQQPENTIKTETAKPISPGYASSDNMQHKQVPQLFDNDTCTTDAIQSSLIFSYVQVGRKFHSKYLNNVCKYACKSKILYHICKWRNDYGNRNFVNEAHKNAWELVMKYSTMPMPSFIGQSNSKCTIVHGQAEFSKHQVTKYSASIIWLAARQEVRLIVL